VEMFNKYIWPGKLWQRSTAKSTERWSSSTADGRASCLGLSGCVHLLDAARVCPPLRSTQRDSRAGGYYSACHVPVLGALPGSEALPPE